MALAEVVSSSEKAEAFKEQFPVLECLLWLFERKRKGSALDENPDEKKKKAEHARKQYLEQEAFIAALRQKADDLIEKRGEERECYDEFCEASSSRNPVLGTVMTLSRNDQPSVEAVLEAAREQHRGTLSSLTTRTSARRSVLGTVWQPLLVALLMSKLLVVYVAVDVFRRCRLSFDTGLCCRCPPAVICLFVCSAFQFVSVMIGTPRMNVLNLSQQPQNLAALVACPCR